MQLGEVDVAPIHHVEGADLRDQVIEDVDLVPNRVGQIATKGLAK